MTLEISSCSQSAASLLAAYTRVVSGMRYTTLDPWRLAIASDFAVRAVKPSSTSDAGTFSQAATATAASLVKGVRKTLSRQEDSARMC